MKLVPEYAGIASAICLAGMVLLLLLELGLRVFGILVPSADDFTTFLMVGAAYFGFVHAYAAGHHVRVELLYKRFGGKLRRSVEIVSLTSATLLLAWLAFSSFQLVATAWRFKDMSDTIVPIPLWMPMGVVPLGLALFALTTGVDAARAILHGEIRKSESEVDEALELAGLHPRSERDQ